MWYAPGPGGYVVVRPSYGVVVTDLPPFRTTVTIAGITYLYLNGVYYRERTEAGYEVVATPVAALGTASGAPGRLYVYPAQAQTQTAEQQATDEYKCHSWAAQPSGFDPAPAATGQAVDAARRADYVRAQTMCARRRRASKGVATRCADSISPRPRHRLAILTATAAHIAEQHCTLCGQGGSGRPVSFPA